MVSYLVLVLAVLVGANAQSDTACSKQIELEHRCMLTIETSPEATMLRDRMKQAHRTCAPDYPQECHAQFDAAHECATSIAKNADSDDLFKESKPKSQAAVDECFEKYPPDVKQGFGELFMSNKPPHHKPKHHKKWHHHRRNSTSASGSGESGEASASASGESGESNSASNETSSSFERKHGGGGGGGRHHGGGGRGGGGRGGHGRHGGRCHHGGRHGGRGGRGGRGGHGGHHGLNATESGSNSNESNSNSASGSHSKEFKKGGSSSNSSSASHSKEYTKGGRSNSNSNSGSHSKEHKKGGRRGSGGKSGGRSGSGERKHMNPQCRKTKEQKQCVKDELKKLAKDDAFVDVMDTLMRQKKKCKQIIDWSCTAKCPKKQKCIFKATKPCRQAFMTRMQSCMQQKGFTLPPFMMRGDHTASFSTPMPVQH